MKKLMTLSFLSMILLMMSGCQVIGDIFKAGVWVGIIVVVIIIALVLWLIGKAKK